MLKEDKNIYDSPPSIVLEAKKANAVNSYFFQLIGFIILMISIFYMFRAIKLFSEHIMSISETYISPDFNSSHITIPIIILLYTFLFFFWLSMRGYRLLRRLPWSRNNKLLFPLRHIFAFLFLFISSSFYS